MPRKYRPSNGNDGMIFESHFCDRCAHEDEENDLYCEIKTNAIMHDIDHEEYPKEWIAEDDFKNPRCTAFKESGE